MQVPGEITDDDLAQFQDADHLTDSQRIKVLEINVAKMLPVFFGYIDKEGKTFPGAVRRLASLEKWVKFGVLGGGFLGVVQTFGLADSVKHMVVSFLGGKI